MWGNWSGEQRCVPACLVRPASTEEVAAEVRAAAGRGHVVRVAGAGHSFTDAVVTDGTLLSLERMDRVLGADPEAGRVRVQAGIRIAALSEALAGQGLALENLGDINRQTVAGAVSTATHGTGARLPNLSAQVEAVQLVAGDGTVHELDAAGDPDALRAARVSVGALGVITELTLRCVPAFTLRGVDRPEPLDAVLGDLDARAAAHDHFELFAFPYTDRALTRANDRVPGPPEPRSPARAWVSDVLAANVAFGAVMAAGRRVPRAVPALNRGLVRVLGEEVRVDRSDRVFASPRHVRFTEMEYAVPRAAAVTMVREVLALIRRDRLPVGFPLELRVVAGDDALLSPAHGRDTAYVAAHVPIGVPWERYFRAVEAIADAHDGRPHWGKRHFQTAHSLASRYPEWERFQAVRARLDPAGRFTNEYVRRTLGGVRALSLSG